MLRCVALRCAVLCCVVLCCVALCCVVLRCAVCVALGCAVLCCVALCCVVLASLHDVVLQLANKNWKHLAHVCKSYVKTSLHLTILASPLKKTFVMHPEGKPSSPYTQIFHQPQIVHLVKAGKQFSQKPSDVSML